MTRLRSPHFAPHLVAVLADWAPRTSPSPFLPASAGEGVTVAERQGEGRSAAATASPA